MAHSTPRQLRHGANTEDFEITQHDLASKGGLYTPVRLDGEI
jgi:hypothetical protein